MLHVPPIMLIASFLALAASAGSGEAAAPDMPARASLQQLLALPAAVERSPAGGGIALVAPRSPAPARDPRGAETYAAVVYAYVVDDGGDWVRRVAVRAPGAEFEPFARRAARLAATVWRTLDRRLGAALPRLRSRTLPIWLARSGDGAVTERENIYIMGVAHERSGLEWLREIAHEYGHYALPGASGYDEPEPWANGLLGERLLLWWMLQDLRAGVLAPDDLPGVSATDLEDYVARQVTPLLERVRSAQPDRAALALRTARAADDFTALLLWADATYGPAPIAGLLDYLPQGADAASRGPDFLAALLAWLRASPDLTVTLHAPRTRVYTGQGAYVVSGAGVTRLSVAGASASRAGAGWLVRSPSAGWKTVQVTADHLPITLGWRRR